MAAETLINVPDSCFHCCSKCKGLFPTSDDHLKHNIVCNGNPFKSTCMHFACERKIYLQLFQTEDFPSDGSYSQLNMSKDDSFIDHVVKIRMPQDLIDPSIFLRTNTSSNLQIPLLDSNNLEADVTKNNDYLQPGNKSRFSESIEQDQLRNIINKNIDYLKSDDITALTSSASKDLAFPQGQSEPRLLSPIEKHFLPDGPKSRVQSPFEKCINYLQETGSGYQSGSLAYASNQSIPFSCNLSTDLLGGLAPAQDENLTSVNELPTLQYLDLAKKDIFFGQNPGLNQMNTKDPFLINATVKADRPVPSAPRDPAQSSKSCEDLTSPTFPLQDGNYFNFPSTLDEPTQLDYLDLATLDFLTNPSSFGNYGSGMFRDRFADDREDIYSECNFLFHDLNTCSTDNAEKSEKQSFEENVKLKKSKIKRFSLKKVKRGIEKKNKTSNNKKNSNDSKDRQKADTELKLQALTDSLADRPIPDKKPFKRTYSAEYEQLKPTPLSRKRKLMSCNDTLSFRISPEAKRKAKVVDRKFNESQRLCPTNAILNVKDSLVGFSEEEKKSMTAVIGQMGCIVVKKQKPSGRADLGTDQIITEVSTGPGENKLFVLDGKNLQTYESPTVTSAIKVPLVNPTPVNGNGSENVKSVLKLKCQFCSFKTTSVTEFQDHRSMHDIEADKCETTKETLEDVNTGETGQTVLHVREHLVNKSADDVHGEVLDNNVFIEESLYYKESVESVQYIQDTTVDQTESNINPDRGESIDCLNETILELCDQLEVGNISNSQNFESLSNETNEVVPNKTKELHQCEYGRVDESHNKVASSEAPLVESTQTTSDSIVQMSFNSDGMFCTNDSIVSLDSDVSYNEDVLAPSCCTTNADVSLGTECQLSPMNSTFNETLQPEMSVNIGPDTELEKDTEPERGSNKYFENCKNSTSVLTQDVLPIMIPDIENTISEDSLTAAESKAASNLIHYDDTLNEITAEEPEHHSEEEITVTTKTDVKMVSEETQTVSSYYIDNPPTIYIFGQPKSPDRESYGESEVDKLDKSTQGLETSESITTTTRQCQVNADDVGFEVYNISSDVFDVGNASEAASLEHGGIVAASTECETETSSNVVQVSPKIFTSTKKQVNQNVFSHSSTASCDQYCQTNSDLDEHTDVNVNVTVQVDVQSNDVKVCKTSDDVNHHQSEIKRTSTPQADLPAVMAAEKCVSLPGTDLSNDAEVEKDDRVSVMEETAAELQPQSIWRTPVSVTELDHSYSLQSLGIECKSTSRMPVVASNQPSNSSSKTDDTFYTCEDCGFKTSRKGTMKAHTVKHEGVQLSCSVPGCDFKTVHKRCLNFHLLKHNSEYQLLCDQCAFTTTDSKTLRRHMQLKHYHQYRYKCPDCDHLSMFRERIANHYRNAHLQEKLYACNQCDYRTGYTHLLKFHLMAHAGIRPYKCSACDYQVNNVNKVTRHIRTRHKGQTGVTCKKLDLNFEVDAKQFQCETKTCDKDINVIVLTDEQVTEIVDMRLAKQEKCLQEKLKPDIPVFDPKTMQPKKMVSLLPSRINSPEKQMKEPVCTANHLSKISFVQIPLNQANIVTRNSNLVANRRSLDDSHLVKTKSSYKGMENIWTSIKPPQKTVSEDSVIKDQNMLVRTESELDSEYQCSMCEYRLKSHDDIANHLLVCKMERNKLT